MALQKLSLGMPQRGYPNPKTVQNDCPYYMYQHWKVVSGLKIALPISANVSCLIHQFFRPEQ